MTRRCPDLAFPTERFVPGHGPHPRHHDHLPKLPPPDGSRHDGIRWRYGLDLFDARFWWEAHEVWEGLWLTLPRTSAEAQLVQGMIQLAASRLTGELGRVHASARLRERAVRRIRTAASELDMNAWDIDADALIATHSPEQQAPR